VITPGPPPSSGFGVQSSSEPQIVENSYIVRLKPDTTHDQHDSHLTLISNIHAQDVSSRHALNAVSVESVQADLGGLINSYKIGEKVKGYHGKFSEKVLQSIRAQPEVLYVEKDSMVYASDIEKGAPWGLARLSHRKPLSFGTFNKYEYEHRGGEGVTAYIVDTGINIDHVDFEGRAKWGKTIPKNDQDIDANGHGTHVAGTVGSSTYGVAKAAHLVAVKVLGSNGSGTMADVVGGVAWAAEHAEATRMEAQASNSTTYRGSVANMSLGGGKSPSLDDAVDAATETGLFFAVAAGNDNRDACTFSPAAAAGPITVGATAISDKRAYFSNHGKCVDVFAPGLNILSTWNSGNRSTNSISGTSMASPHICGLGAYFLSLYPTSFAPTAEDYLLAGEAVPFHLSANRDSSLSAISWPSQFVFGKLREWTGFGSAPAKTAKKSHDHTVTPKVLKQAIVRLSTKGILEDLPAQTVNLLAFNNYTSSV